MKKLILALAFILGGAVSAFGQSTTVSGQVTDGGGQSWNNGTFTATFVPNPQFPVGPYTWTGGTLNTTISGTLNGTGAYSVSIPSNTAIKPQGSQWQIQFVPNATSSPFLTAKTTIIGATQTLNATPPDISINLQNPPGPFTTAYADDEIATPIPQGAEYFNTTSLLTRVWNGSAWANQGASAGGGVTPCGGAANTQIAFFTAATAICGDPNFTWATTTGSLTAAGAAGSVTKISNGPGQFNELIIDSTGPSVTLAAGETGGTLITEGVAGNQVIADTGNLDLIGNSIRVRAFTPGLSGALIFPGGTSGSASIGVPLVAGTPNPLQLPTTTGEATALLQTDGGNPQQLSFKLAGVPTNAQTGASYTYVATDRASYVSFSNAGAIAATLPQAGSTGFGSNFVNVSCDIGAGTATITPTTSTISYTNGSTYTSGAATLPLSTGQCAWIYSDNTNYFAIVRASTGGTVTSFSAGTLSPLFTTSVATATTTPALSFSLSNAAGGTLFGNRTGASAAPAFTATPVLGIPTSVIGTLGFAGNTSGTATITPQATAGTPTLTLPNATGTFAVSASAPLSLSATTGALTCATCVTSAASLTSNALVLGAGGQATATNTAFTTNGTTTLTIGVAGGGNGVLALAGNTSGTATFTAPATAGTTTNPVTASNVQLGPNGDSTHTTYGVGLATSGLYAANAADNPTLTVTGASGAGVGMASGGSPFFYVGLPGTYFHVSIPIANSAQSFKLTSRNAYGFSVSATDASQGQDTGISRPSTGTILFDTGTIGNGLGTAKAGAYRVSGTKFTASGCTNSATVGGATAGQFTSGTTGACTVTVTMGDSDTATNGWSCWASDQTTPANTYDQKAGGSTTTAVFTGTTVSGDVISFGCMAY
jgi:hypothetical protein